jgi:hypothetical protein
MNTLIIKRIYINKTHCSKTPHPVVEINLTLIEGLVDTNASMSIMVANVVREFDIMYLVLGHEVYKITSRTITQALRQIIDILITIGKVVCQMIFLVVNTNNYDLLLRLDFLMKIGGVIDVEKGVIHVEIDMV